MINTVPVRPIRPKLPIHGNNFQIFRRLTIFLNILKRSADRASLHVTLGHKILNGDLVEYLTPIL